MDDHKTLLNLAEFETAARARLPRMVFDYYAGGAGDEVTARTAHDAWDAVSIRYRVLRDVSSATLAANILGDELGLPAARRADGVPAPRASRR